jgi:hypothetical protein
MQASVGNGVWESNRHQDLKEEHFLTSPKCMLLFVNSFWVQHLTLF